ncbi:MAG: hypothetical protein U0V70_07675 [Terriglobia bacterium]
MKNTVFVCLLVLFAGETCLAEDYPQAQISNSVIQMKVYLPDAHEGFYRGTRVDWSGVVASLAWSGHNYFGNWFEKHDPTVHDSICGPVEEFLTGKAALGYLEAKVGEPFVKIGVGALRKREEENYSSFATYEILNSGQWSTKSGSNWIEFVQKLPVTNGYAYVYRKKIWLEKGKPILVQEHSLKNTGRKVIESSVYDHNFFMMDGQPSGPDFVLRFPFDLRATEDLKGLAKIQGKELTYLAALQSGQYVYTHLEGYGTNPADDDIRIENRKTGAGVRIKGNRPLSKLAFWSNPKLVCPEPFIDLRLESGKQATWRITYEFYQVSPSTSRP